MAYSEIVSRLDRIVEALGGGTASESVSQPVYCRLTIGQSGGVLDKTFADLEGHYPVFITIPSQNSDEYDTMQVVTFLAHAGRYGLIAISSTGEPVLFGSTTYDGALTIAMPEEENGGNVTTK